MDYIAFYCALKHSSENEDFLIQSLKSYDIGSFLVVREIAEFTHQLTNGEHYHFLVQMSNEDYGRYRKRVFIDHYKLRGQAKKGEPRQYGKVNYLKNPDRMAIYMMKDFNQDEKSKSIVATTMTDSQLETWHQQSFKKGDKEQFRDVLEKYVEEQLKLECTKLVRTIMKLDDEILCQLDEREVVEGILWHVSEYYVKFNRQNAISTDEKNPYRGKKLSITKAQIRNFQNYFLLYNPMFKEVPDFIISALLE